MCDTMEEIDQFIQEYTQEQELKDYIHKGIYPERLTTNHLKKPKYIPTKLDNIIMPELITIENITTKEELLDTNQKLFQKITQLEKTLKENIHKENDCPICMEDMGNHFVSPECGHKLCIKCFATNIRYNRQNCNQCCLCRREMM